MADPTLTISIDRASLSLSPLLFSGKLDGTQLGVVEFNPPSRMRRYDYAPDSPWVHGSELIGSSLVQSSLVFSWMRVGATAQSDIQTAYDTVAAALDQQSYTVTTTVNGGAAKVWAADPGSLELAGNRLDRIHMQHLVPVYAVTIPVYPIAG